MIESFNQEMLDRADQVWAVAVPVSIRYDGDAEPGSIVYGHNFPTVDEA